MNKLFWSIPLAALLIFAGFYLSRTDTGSERVVAKTDDLIWKNQDVANSLTDAVETPFNFDVDRLYDISYEADLALGDFADSIGKSPACLIELVRRQIDGIVPSETVCKEDSSRLADNQVVLPGTYERVCHRVREQEVCRRVKVADHSYEQYSDDELRALAGVSPEAAVILARRTPDNALSEQYYEQAVVLSGRPGPLEEWMLHRSVGGLVRVGGVLDIDKAKVGYEIYLTTSQLGGYGKDAAADYERVLKDANVDLEPIQKRADERLTRLTAARQAIIGSAWEN